MMKFSTIFRILILLSIIPGWTACKDDNDFTGGDNYITQFDLTVGGISYKSVFNNDEIILSVPEGISLRGAKASVTLSENASILPDPAEITNWDEEEQFVVTAYDKSRRSYVYRVLRTAVSVSGNVLLNTQAEVDAFASTGISVIDGNLTIGKTSGGVPTDTITDLSGLRNLKQVVYNLIINSTYGGSDLQGLSQLEKAGGIKITSVRSLSTIEFPYLHTVGTHLSITGTEIKTLSMTSLSFVGESFTVKSDSLRNIDFGKLHTIGGDLIFNGSNGSAQKNTMTTLALPKLKEVGGLLTISYWPNCEKLEIPSLQMVGGAITLSYWNKTEELEMPSLETAGGLSLSYCNNLAELKFPLLNRLDGLFNLANVLKLSILELPEIREISGKITLSAGGMAEAEFPKLEKAGDISIPSAASNLTTLRFPVLKTITGELSVQSSKLADLNGFKKLESIGSRLHLYNATGIASLSGLSSLKKVGTYYAYGMTSLQEIDVRGMEVNSLEIYTSTWNNLKIIGDDHFAGKLYLNSPPSGTGMPVFQGFRKINNLSVSTGSYSGKVELAGIEEVGELLDFTSSNNTPAISMPDLKKAGGIKFNYNNSLTSIHFPLLEEITGYVDAGGNGQGGFTYPVSSAIPAITLPELKKIKGNLSLSGLSSSRPLSTVSFPRLTTLEGSLTITGSSNTHFRSVEGFSALNSVEGVNISGFPQLFSFEGLKGVIPYLTENGWKISGCGYIPTYQNMVEGIYTKP